MVEGNIFSIQHFSLNDGPGIRTTIFLKGCNLRCYWCHNPESQFAKPQLMYNRKKCTECLVCVESCPNHAHMLEPSHHIDREKCNACGLCVEACPGNALEIVGKLVTDDEVFSYVSQDKVFYDMTGGGITFSGGEPLCQYEFILQIAKKCVQHKIHVCVDTSLAVPFRDFEIILPYIDLFLVDIKSMNMHRYEWEIGKPKVNILTNINKLDKMGKRMIVRYPTIRGFNDSDDDIKLLADFLLDKQCVEEVHIIPVMNHGMEKYMALGIPYKKIDNKDIQETLYHIQSILVGRGIQNVKIL
jgi:pyruvate formate lyase activating enzyme